jgi:hypothetical protein
MATSLQFALSNPLPGMDDEFNRWYGSEHLLHGLMVPGVDAAQRFRRVDSHPLPAGSHDYLMIWEFDDPRFALEQLALVKGTDKMPISPAIDMTTVQPPTMWLRASVRSAARIATDTSTRETVVFALFNAVANASEALESHILDGGLRKLADLPGVMCADFLTLAEEQIRGNARKFQFGLLIELADEEKAMPALIDAFENMAYLDRSKWLASAFSPLGIRLTASDVERMVFHRDF